MNTFAQGVASLGGRIMIATIFLLSAVGNKIPQFNAVAGYMASEGVPAPQLMLVGAIVFLIAGSASLVLGFRARAGAALLLAFLVLATYFFHDFWSFEGAERQNQMIQFMKNLSMMGTMVFVIANGAGAFSLDRRLATGSVHQNSARCDSMRRFRQQRQSRVDCRCDFLPSRNNQPQLL